MSDYISFEGVSKYYKVGAGRKTVLKTLTAEFPQQNVGILGANGAGKSTLLRMIAGVESPSSGTIRRHCRVSWPLGFAGSFNGSLSGAENCRFVARIYGEDTRRVEQFVGEFSELGAFFRMPFSTYSAGMRARLAFGISLAIEFDAYLVDEITEVGDEQFRERCRSYFKTKLRGANVIMVSHGLSSLRSYCDSGVVLHNGDLMFFNTLEAAIDVHQTILQSHANSLAEANA